MKSGGIEGLATLLQACFVALDWQSERALSLLRKAASEKES